MARQHRSGEPCYGASVLATVLENAKSACGFATREQFLEILPPAETIEGANSFAERNPIDSARVAEAAPW